MRALIVIGSIMLVFFLIGLIPLGVSAAYDADGFALSLRVWLFSIRLGSGKEKPVQSKKSPQKEKGGQVKKKRELPPIPVLKLLASNGYALLCRLVSRLRVEILKIHFVSSFPDPCHTAMAYAAAGMAMDGLLRVGEGRIVHPDLRADVDFDADKPLIDICLCLTVRIGQMLAAALRFGAGVLRDYLKYKKEQ